MSDDINDLIGGLEHAKHLVSRMAWAFQLHLENDGRIEREGENINGRIDSAIDRLRILTNRLAP